IPAAAAGTSVPFQFQLPKTITPSFSTITHELKWWLVAKTGSFFGTKLDVAVPLEIFDASAAASTQRLRAAPILSDERVTRTFESFALGSGWSRTEDADGLALERDRQHIAYDYRGKEGTFLVSRITHS